MPSTAHAPDASADPPEASSRQALGEPARVRWAYLLRLPPLGGNRAVEATWRERLQQSGYFREFQGPRPAGPSFRPLGAARVEGHSATALRLRVESATVEV